MLTCPVCGMGFNAGRVHYGETPCIHTCETYPQEPTKMHVTIKTEGRIERLRAAAKEKQNNG